MIDPPAWDDARLERDRLESVHRFRAERLDEPVEVYARTVEQQKDIVAALLDCTDDLRDCSPEKLCDILADPRYRDAFRYLAGPPISDDD